MGETWKYYDVADFNNWKRKQLQSNAYRPPPRANFLAAANHIKGLFEAKKFNWAVFGGLAMLCLGYRRDMSDLHIVYEDRDFPRIKSKLEADPRVRLPNGMNALFPTKLLIQTGPKYKDAGCADNVDVEVNLVPPGSHGTPSQDVFRRSQIMLRLSRDGNGDSFKGLNMLYLIKTAIHYCKSQDLAWDPRNDLLFMCQHYAKEVEPFRHHLNAREILENFLGTPSFSHLPIGEQRQCYHVLLGKEPPPAMFITSPATPTTHRPTASTSDIQKPRISTHKSAPSLNNAMQQRAALLSPPLPGRPKAAPTTPANAPPPQAAAQLPRPHGLAVDAAAEKKYRHTSVPNMANTGRNVSLEANAPITSRPQSTGMRAPQSQPRTGGVQNGIHIPKPHMAAGNGPSPMPVIAAGARSQKSMPDMGKRSTSSVPVFAHGQNNVSSAHKDPGIPGHMSTGPMTAGFTTPQRPQQNNPPHGVPSTTQNNPAPRPAMPHNPQMPAQPLPRRQVPAHNGQYSSNDQGASTTTSQPAHAEVRAPITRGLSVVGPEGLYPAPLKPRPHKQNQPAVSGPQGNASASPSNFVFELDASSPRAASAPHFQNGPSQEFIAELPADMGAPMSTQLPPRHSETQFSPLQGTSLRDSPVSPPLDSLPAPAMVGPSQSSQQATPQGIHTPPVPVGSLPASLMAGGQRRSPRNSVPHAPQLTQSQSTANPYQQYYSPPSSVPNSNNPSPKQAHVGLYKAYSGPMSPPLQPASAPAQLQKPPSMANMQASIDAPQHYAGPQYAATQQNSQHHYPNVLMTNPPTPPTTIALAKHDSHQGHHPPATKVVAAGATVAAVGGVNHAAYSYHTSEHTAQHQEYSAYEYEQIHQRNLSHESNVSHDSAKLAQEYQMDLPDFDNGYGSDHRSYAEEVHVDYS